MFFDKLFSRKNGRRGVVRSDGSIVVVLAAKNPQEEVVNKLASMDNVTIREAFTSRGIIRGLPDANLVILDDVLVLPDSNMELVNRTMEMSGIPTCSVGEFAKQPDEWLGRARLASTRQITFLPSRQVNMINWSGGVGKTTLAMTVCKRFVERTGLPAAMLELSMGGSALHARVADDLPEFYAIATGTAEPATWHGVHVYPMDGRTTDVLMSEDPTRVRRVLDDIRKNHTLFVVDCFPGHPLYKEISEPRQGMVNLIVSSPRDDSLLRARKLLGEVTGGQMVLNMCKTAADRMESAAVRLPYNEGWAQSCDKHLAEPILGLVYTGWERK